ncbi:MAG: hypothetical protein A3J76_01610 [Candidatus Moranbacteria bacterium RBG_13_45_13]|nr:MAG: hypothetical protein A3J76_01610 [Candidatus Moranbacteria bacterium RBG_13_45_13]
MNIERNLYKTVKKYLSSPENIVVTGMRRTGKTYFLRYIFDRIDSKNKLFLDLENPVSRKYFEEENYDRIVDNLAVLGLDPKKQGYIFLDEIQLVKNLPTFVKYIHDHHRMKFFLSGSASFYLKKIFSESLAGRKYLFELHPLDFAEFLRFKRAKIKIPGSGVKITKAQFETINRYFEEYVQFGGFPAVVLKDSADEKKMMLDDIFSSYFQLEVQGLGDFRKINVVRDLILLLAQRSGSRLDIQKLSRELGVTRVTIGEYLSFLEGTYFIKLIRPFSRNKDTEIRKMPKFYLCDSGMANHLAKLDSGVLFENTIFSLLRLKGELNYYQRKSGVEIDFILDKNSAFEVKATSGPSDARKLSALAREIGIGDFQIISRNFSLSEKVIYGFQL